MLWNLGGGESRCHQGGIDKVRADICPTRVRFDFVWETAWEKRFAGFLKVEKGEGEKDRGGGILDVGSKHLSCEISSGEGEFSFELRVAPSATHSVRLLWLLVCGIPMEILMRWNPMEHDKQEARSSRA